MMTSCEEALDHPPPVQEASLPLVLVAAGALIDADGRILIAKRPQGKKMAGLWEFPGGKIESGEQPEFALMRELREELGIETRPGCFSPIAFASHLYEDFYLMMPLYACRTWRGTPEAIEHEALRWVWACDLWNYPMPGADKPLIPQLEAILPRQATKRA